MKAPSKDAPQVITLTSPLGMSQRQDSDQIGDNQSPLLINISNDKPGTWSKRNGISELNSISRATGGIKGLIEWTANTSAVNNNLRIHSFRGTQVTGAYNLEYFDQSVSTFTTIDNSQTSIDQIESVNYKDIVYHISKNNYLAYESGGGLTTVTSANIKADCMCVSQNTLFVGNVTTINGAATDQQSRVYYSDFSSNTPSDNLFDSSRNQTIATSTNFFTVLAPIKGLFAFSALGVLCVFTRDACFTFDVRLLDSRTGPIKRFNIGLIHKRAITECNGIMYWIDYEGRIWGWSGYGLPVNVSWELQDDENGEAILSALNRSDLTVFCAGSINNKIYFGLGTSITYKGQTINNPVLKGLVGQNNQNITWSLDDFPVRPAIFRQAVVTLGSVSKRRLIFGSATTDDIYAVGYGLIDGLSTAISASAKTKFMDFGMPIFDKNYQRLLIKYRPQPNPGTYLIVKWAVNGNFTYTTLSNPVYTGSGLPATGTVGAGTIDMNVGYTSTSSFYTQILNLPPECNGKSISIEVSNNTANQDFEVSAIAIEFIVTGYEMSPLTS